MTQHFMAEGVTTFEKKYLNSIAAMKDILKFKSLTELATDLGQKLELLSEGRLSKTDLETLTIESRELYERLVVLRFKAYDSEVKGITVIEPRHEEVVIEQEAEPIPQISFRIEEPKAEVPVQVSLIDAIEEVAKAEEAQEVEPILAQEVTPVAVAESVIADAPSPVQFVPASPIEKAESLHDRLTKTFGNSESIAEKLEHHPIPDLKRAITLNQRFQFSRELFKGNNQDYEVAIDKLNTSNRDEAMRHLESLKNKYAWNNESPVATDFVGLVERRHQ